MLWCFSSDDHSVSYYWYTMNCCALTTILYLDLIGLKKTQVWCNYHSFTIKDDPIISRHNDTKHLEKPWTRASSDTSLGGYAPSTGIGRSLIQGSSKYYLYSMLENIGSCLLISYSINYTRGQIYMLLRIHLNNIYNIVKYSCLNFKRINILGEKDWFSNLSVRKTLVTALMCRLLPIFPFSGQ